MTEAEKAEITNAVQEILDDDRIIDKASLIAEYVYRYANPPTLGVSVDETVKADAKFGG